MTVTARTQPSIDSLTESAGSNAELLHGIAGDYGLPGGLERALVESIAARGAFDLALVYTPGGATVARAALAAHPPEVMVDLLTSSHGAPGTDDGDRERVALRGRIRSVRLLLGWSDEGVATRWHTPDEISEAALESLEAADGSELTLGALRPWRDRPR